MNLPGTLYIVATPIGNPRDITLRAIDILKEVDAVICEERRQGSTILKQIGVQAKELIELNEHNEAEKASDLAMQIIQGRSMALISDCGTPLFADPGAALIRAASEIGVTVSPVPGASSLMAALSVVDTKLDSYYFAGFLPPKSDQRRQRLNALRYQKTSIVLMDTPYRLVTVLDEVMKAFGSSTNVTLAMDLTLPSELILRGRLGDVKDIAGQRKAEFILIIHQ
ncbi:MAG TPA: SAM-dependent methyltransferase [Longilinea sp.]|nr:SAM-dependent methyltransferase [Longilinea sp.]